MDSSTHAIYQIEDRSYVSFVKREIHNLLAKNGFSESRTGETDIIVAELTSNLIKHAQSGEVLYKISEEPDGNKAFEIISLDNGKGTDDIQRMMRDGASTTNTLGNGLGAIQRLSDFFQIYSASGGGTVAVSKIFKDALPEYRRPPHPKVLLKAVQVCYPGETVCGDGYDVVETAEETRIFVGDGLGHGPNAHHAVQEAIKAFRECSASTSTEVLRYIHQKVKKTRGLVATVAILSHSKKQWNICGVGNISTKIHQGLVYKNYMSHNGIVGLNIPGTMNDYIIEAEQFQTIVMCSDGIKTRWELSRYPSILKHDPSILAALLFKDHARRNDDMTVLVGKVNL